MKDPRFMAFGKAERYHIVNGIGGDVPLCGAKGEPSGPWLRMVTTRDVWRGDSPCARCSWAKALRASAFRVEHDRVRCGECGCAQHDKGYTWELRRETHDVS